MTKKAYEYDLPNMATGEKRLAQAWANVPPSLSKEQKDQFKTQIKALLKSKNAVLVAHYYVDGDIQSLAEETGGCVGDSLEMARFGRDHASQMLIVAGVKFMGETAKILSPVKRVFMVAKDAQCSLDLGCPAEDFATFCEKHPDRVPVVYANTSAAVKAHAQWMATSSIGLQIVKKLHEEGKKIIWAPDCHLGQYIQEQTGADMLLWQGSCLVHDEFKAHELAQLKQRLPNAQVLVHPESSAAVVALADVVGSTSQLLNAAKKSTSDTFIVATDKGIFHKMKEVMPDKTFIEAPTAGNGATCKSCAQCPWMAMSSLQGVFDVLTQEINEVLIDETIRQNALGCIERMLAFSQQQKSKGKS